MGRVTVIPFYMGFRQGESQQNNVYWWRYCIRLENLGQATVQLRERNWRIFPSRGPLKQSEAVVLLVRNLCCPETSRLFNIVHMYHFKRPVVTCGEHSEWRGKMDTPLIAGYLHFH